MLPLFAKGCDVPNADALAQLSFYSISPGPITLASLMDPDSYKVSEEIRKLDTEKELARYNLFPMYPTCQ